jgi:hypothetical protein
VSGDVLALGPGERLSPGGVILPKRDEGHLVLAIATNAPAQPHFNVALEGAEEDVEEEARRLAERITALQMELEMGTADPCLLELREPHFGYRWYGTRTFVRSVMSVTPSYAQRVDPSVLVRQAEERHVAEESRRAQVQQARMQVLAQKNGRPPRR